MFIKHLLKLVAYFGLFGSFKSSSSPAAVSGVNGKKSAGAAAGSLPGFLVNEASRVRIAVKYKFNIKILKHR